MSTWHIEKTQHFCTVAQKYDCTTWFEWPYPLSKLLKDTDKGSSSALSLSLAWISCIQCCLVVESSPLLLRIGNRKSGKKSSSHQTPLSQNSPQLIVIFDRHSATFSNNTWAASEPHLNAWLPETNLMWLEFRKWVQACRETVDSQQETGCSVPTPFPSL